jgi:hypothetical protein
MEGETDSAWNLLRDKEYSFGDRGRHGPSLAATTCCQEQSLANLFIFFFPSSFCKQSHKRPIGTETSRIGYVLLHVLLVWMMMMMMMIVVWTVTKMMQNKIMDQHQSTY